MSQAGKIYALIEKERAELKSNWRGRGIDDGKDIEEYPLKRERDKTYEDLLGKIEEMFPDDESLGQRSKR